MNILVVEDEHKVAFFIKDGLEENNYEVKVAFDALSGEKMASLHSFDLFILDVILPDITGFTEKR